MLQTNWCKTLTRKVVRRPLNATEQEEERRLEEEDERSFELQDEVPLSF